MKKIIFFLLLCCSQQLIAQKIEITDNAVTVDGKPYAQVEKEGCKGLSKNCIYTVKNTAGKTLIIVTRHSVYMAESRSQSNPDGTVLYAQYVFLDSIGQKAEMERVYMNTEKFVKFLVKSQFIKDDALDAEAVRSFVLVNGTPFSDRRHH